MRAHQVIKILTFTMMLASPGPGVWAANGGCPAGDAGKAEQPPVTSQKGIVEVYTEAELPLANEAMHAPGWRFRARSVAIGPGAVIPLHSHDNRPETVMMKHGQLTIYETDCKTGYTMKEGDVYQSGHGKSHWAVNESGHFSIMYVVDLVKDDTFPVADKRN
ncbi:cupin domain-containing protein [Klebsiella aerogenes]|uniref:cupin domain-containing protein n=1 Tax=Klebsiella aerogenes TaxID=548 RepID=UPI001F1E5F0C|nr:cupin domain-containing protein [Klebsiella aerogenes]